MPFYLIVSEEFAQQYHGFEKDENTLSINQIRDGRYVCSTNALTVFEELFTDSKREQVELSAEDFELPNLGLVTAR